MNAPYRSPHLRNKPAMNIKAKPGGSMGKPGGGTKAPEHENDANNEHEHTAPHPMTGAHKMTIAHHGGGKYTTVAHHGGGKASEPMHHLSEGDMHNEVKNNFPISGDDDNKMAENEPDGDEQAMDMGMTGLGGE